MGKKRKTARGKETGGERVQQRRSAMNIKDEVAYIIGRAQKHEARFVSLGPLVFFSTESGDAWMLDTEDAMALCLARDGLPQPVRIVETEQQFGIEWDRQFCIDGDMFTATDRFGRTTSIIGYPTTEILGAIRRAGGRSLPE